MAKDYMCSHPRFTDTPRCGPEPMALLCYRKKANDDIRLDFACEIFKKYIEENGKLFACISLNSTKLDALLSELAAKKDDFMDKVRANLPKTRDVLEYKLRVKAESEVLGKYAMLFQNGIHFYNGAVFPRMLL